MKKRLGIISLFLILFVIFIVLWNYSYSEGKKEAFIPVSENTNNAVIPSESGVFKRSKFALEYAEMPIDKAHQRSLKTYYNNRAYPGAPPTIPHAIPYDGVVGGKTCLKCHENGGFVAKYNAYAPVTPHPEFTNCRQCHVPVKTKTVFVANSFYKEKAPEVGVNKALLTSPPMIPHQLQLRENCLACHAGPAAPKEIRVSHPERMNCRQCHVYRKDSNDNNGIFKRKK